MYTCTPQVEKLFGPRHSARTLLTLHHDLQMIRSWQSSFSLCSRGEQELSGLMKMPSLPRKAAGQQQEHRCFPKKQSIEQQAALRQGRRFQGRREPRGMPNQDPDAVPRQQRYSKPVP